MFPMAFICHSFSIGATSTEDIRELKGWFSCNRRYRLDRRCRFKKWSYDWDDYMRTLHKRSLMPDWIARVLSGRLVADRGDRSDSGDYMRTSLKQTRRRRKRERHLKMWLRVSAIIFQIFKLIMLEKCLLTILELNWNQRLGHKKTKLNICHHMLTSSTQLQNRSFHVVERTRTSSKCQKIKKALAKRAKILFFIVKYANLRCFCCRRRRGCLSSLFSFSDSRTTTWYKRSTHVTRNKIQNVTLYTHWSAHV